MFLGRESQKDIVIPSVHLILLGIMSAYCRGRGASEGSIKKVVDYVFRVTGLRKVWPLIGD